MEGPCCGLRLVVCSAQARATSVSAMENCSQMQPIVREKGDFQLKDLYKGGECGRVKKVVFQEHLATGEVVVVAGA